MEIGGKANTDLPHKYNTIVGSVTGVLIDSINISVVDRLTADQRRKIFEDIIRAERKARKLAEDRFPSDIQKQGDLFDSLNSTFKNAIVVANKLTEDELRSVLKEGSLKSWFPPVN